MMVMIGVDPHKGSHTAVAVDEGERRLAELRVRSSPKQLERLFRYRKSHQPGGHGLPVRGVKDQGHQGDTRSGAMNSAAPSTSMTAA